MAFTKSINTTTNNNNNNIKNEPLTLLQQVRKWGDLNTDGILDPACKIYTHPNIKGLIGYRIENGCAVVFGDPLCKETDKQQLAEAFKNYCQAQNLKTVYSIISPDFAKSAMGQFGKILIQFGNKLILDPSQDPLTRSGSKAVLLRKKTKHALNEKTEVLEYHSDDPTIEQTIERIGVNWVQKRKGPQVHLCQLNLFGYREGKRWFYAKKENRIVGFLVLNELKAKNGWLLNNLILSSDAPHGTSELLITSTFKKLAEENCHYVTIGPIPSQQLGKIEGLGTMTKWIIQLIFKSANRLFRLNGQAVFWDKFEPKYEPSYLLFEDMSLRTGKALLRAMNANV